MNESSTIVAGIPIPSSHPAFLVLVGVHVLLLLAAGDLFDALPKAERDAVLPPSVPARLAVEAGATQGVGDAGDVIDIDRFGASAPGETVLREYGFTIDNVCAHAKALLA